MRPFWRAALSAFIHQETGAGTAFYVLGTMALLVSAAFIVDTSTATGDATQIKRATDAAALAVAHQATINGDEYDPEQIKELAYQYVKNNLGLNNALDNKLTREDVTVTEGRKNNTRKTYTVEASFNTQPSLLKLGARKQAVYSTAEVINRPTEIAMVLPVINGMSARDLAALKRLSKDFAKRMLDSADGKRDNLWISLVPFSQAVNVYDAQDANRIRRWARPGALNPIELSSLFRTGYASLADRRIPDRRANLLCMYSGLGEEENFFWDEPRWRNSGCITAPTCHKTVALAQSLSHGLAPILSLVKPQGLTTSAGWLRIWMVADKGCPNAALLPLTNDLNKVDERVDQFSIRFNVNYAIAMSWAGAALSPNMRGSEGWGDAKLPLDFNVDGSGDGQKVVIMLADTYSDPEGTGGYGQFDTDSYNFNPGQFAGETGSDGSREFAKRRFEDLCTSFRARNIKFYFVGVRPGDPDNYGQNLFDDIATPGLLICTEGDKRMSFIDGRGFGAAEDPLAARLERIASQIETEGGYVRLIE
ncbi:pilus assembly protein TadG-related protein [Candidatus Symbiopectobacterium sp. 'North America']|uniref:pilus assembly protein TadG-related protein n=1 Tax=Candidatus Symbiopectobacterium sp. 'North America' TaxID=2794574 RepID=UPI001FD44B2D|nr:pilus assembly protein TadG-related protein [Candidatus Symbiopectobacterium sp. 'North America']